MKEIIGILYAQLLQQQTEPANVLKIFWLVHCQERLVFDSSENVFVQLSPDLHGIAGMKASLT